MCGGGECAVRVLMRCSEMHLVAWMVRVVARVSFGVAVCGMLATYVWGFLHAVWVMPAEMLLLCRCIYEYANMLWVSGKQMYA